MLKAIQNNKAKLNLKEDTLTSSVFQLLCYLPQSMFWKILEDAIMNHKGLLDKPGNLMGIEFWPHWKINEVDHIEISNKNYVEPDIFFSFEHLELIIEAKRWDNKKQDKKQWITEAQGYINEFQNGINPKKRVIVLALGGIKDDKSYSFKIDDLNFTVLKCHWSKLLNSISNMRKGLNNSNMAYINHKNILDDLILSFELHGFFAGIWFDKEKEFNRLHSEFNLNNITQWNPIK